MHLKRSFAVIGGDQRQRCLLRQLHGLGFPASAYRVPDTENSAPELSGCLQDAAILILPMPALTGTETVRAEGGGVPLADILDAAEPGVLVCGGMLGPAEAFLRARDISFFDYAKDETLLLQNAELTAEAALPLLLEQLSCPLAGSRILLCGFGRIGKLLARKLRVLGADVTVSARKAQDLELARILGFRRIKTGNWAGALAQYDGIVNTVPAPVVIPEHLQSIRKDCALLELASLPGGFCTEAQALPGYLAARGLPGQYAPESAAAIIRSAIFRSLNQEEAS